MGQNCSQLHILHANDMVKQDVRYVFSEFFYTQEYI